jgi:hypothetical protein
MLFFANFGALLFFFIQLALIGEGCPGAYLKGQTFPKDLRQRGNFGGP